MSAQTFYVLTADKSLAVGDVIPNVTDTNQPNPAWLDPRNIEVSDTLHVRADDCLVDIIRAGDDSPVRVARVSPQGTVRPHNEYYDEGDAEVDDRTPLESDGGWVVEAFEPLTVVLGPQSEHVIAAVREGIRVLEDEEDEAVVETYNAVVNAQHDNPGTVTLHRTSDAAEQALSERGIDGYWWANCISCCWGDEILALAARDLIGTTPDWTQAAYDLLTLPWRSTLPQRLHPEDPAVAS